MIRVALILAPALLAGVALSVLPLAAQTPKALDVKLTEIGGPNEGGFKHWVYNSTENAYSFGNTMCNISRGPITEPEPDPETDQVAIDWYKSPDENHPFCAFLAAAEFATPGVQGGTRFRQISDRSWIKHFFFATDTFCEGSPAHYPTPEPGTLFGRYCKDTYDATVHNGSRNRLAPADENQFDPWQGIWTFTGSQFDGAGNGTHSPPTPADEFEGRLRVKNTSLSSAQKLYFQAFLILSQEQNTNLTEQAADKPNNIGSRRWVATQDQYPNEDRWLPSVPTENNDFLQGSILKQWNGATVTDNESTAETDQGVYYVAVKVTGPMDGLYTYEYAIHNRDHKAGACKVQIDWCPDAKLYGTAQTFDIDDDNDNNWTESFPAGSEYIQFKKEGSGPTNPILWNSIRNISFVSDARPVLGDIRIYPEGGGCPITIPTTVPHQIYNINMGGGCGTPAIRVFSEDIATLTTPGTSFTIWSINHYAESGYCVVRFQLAGVLDPTTPYGCPESCVAWLDQNQLGVNQLVEVNNHRAYFTEVLPTDTQLHGSSVYAQTAENVPGGGGCNGINYGNGLDVRMGDPELGLADCRACQE